MSHQKTNRAVREVVSWAVFGAVNEDSPHPGLQDFLHFADVRESR